MLQTRKLLAIVLILSLAIPASAQQAKPANTQMPEGSERKLPGQTTTGMLLPNGWTLTPEGTQIPVSDLPLNMEMSRDKRYLLVTTNGNGDQTINVIDLVAGRSVQTLSVRKSWLGLAFAPDGNRFYVSGGDDNEVLTFDFADGKATAAGKIILGSSEYHALTDALREATRRAGQGEFAFPAGMAVSPDGKRLYVAENLTNKVAVVDLISQQVVTKINVGDYPYDCTISKDGRRVYVSNWGSRSVAVIDTANNQAVGNIQVGDHPNDLELSGDGRTLYVANANSNTVSVVDTAQMKEVEAISTALHPKSPAGSTPNAVALSPDEKTLYVANADNNDVAIVDVSKRGASKVNGFIPTGWYPTSVRVSQDGKRIFVANGKGTASAANPKGPQPTQARNRETEYIGSMLKGTVSLVNVPDKAKLSQLTSRVYANSPYTDELLKAARAPRERTAIPVRVGDASPIKHVIYVIKENRTYDQILGDMKEGNGDPNLCLFGEDVTPNQHAIAREFVLLDNLYVDAEVSADGHNWSTAAYATDYVEKTWPTNYSRRGRTYDYEGSKKISRPTAGYIWDYCKRAGVSYRSYAEFIGVKDVKAGGGGGNQPESEASRTARRENYTNEDALQGHFSPTYPSWDLTVPDNKRVDAWLEEFREYEKNGQLPQFQIVRLGGDHTQGTRPGAPTPRAHMAENDLAVGRLVEAVSQSEKYWPDTAVFIIEDDAQNGPDHVDAHRSIAFVASAWTKRRYVDSTMYTTSSMLRTMELILGLPPMSQYDAAAIPMFNSFTDKADLTKFKSLPARVDLNEKNPPNAPGAQRSAQLDFSKEDAAPDVEFNEIIWKAVRGADSQMPAPVRSAFVRVIEDDDDDDNKDREKERRGERRKTSKRR
ncbi:MAG TPA: beta-propeller fold lactonase family protein [Blastocatellia bacterium]|nr:beta-propeller fold lactonase family protein [Blastocatellia bacterium]